MPKIAIPLSFLLLLLAIGEIVAAGRQNDLAFQTRLCRAFLCDPNSIQEVADHLADSGSPATADLIRDREMEVVNDPASPFRWCDLGEAYFGKSNLDKTRACFRQAQALGPNNPAILLRIANFHFQLQEYPEALRLTSIILGRVPDYNDVIFSSYSRFDVPIETVLTIGIPLKKDVAQAYLNFLFPTADIASTNKAWEWAISHSFLDDKLAATHVNQLLHQKEYTAAIQSWAGYLHGRRGDYLRPNLLFNGSFEFEPTGSLLDWVVEAVDGARISRDPSVRAAGAYSLRVAFGGTTNLDFHNVSQSAIVSAGSYRFQVLAKCAGLTTDEGVSLRIFDPASPARLDALTDQLLGSGEWRKLEKTVEVSPATRLITIQMVRHPSQKFDNKIAGTVWIDAASLVRAGSPVP